MTLTDFVPAVLENLRLSVAMNGAALGGEAKSASALDVAASPATQGALEAGAAAESTLAGRSAWERREATEQLAEMGTDEGACEDTDPELWDPEDADSCDDLDFMNGCGSGTARPDGNGSEEGTAPGQMPADHVSS